MASVWKHPNSKYWSACYSLPDGRQVKKSTKQTSKTAAKRVAEMLQSAARPGLSESKARELAADLYEQCSGKTLVSATVRDFLARWMQRKSAEVEKGTARKYQDVAKHFISFLGNAADSDLASVTASQVAAFRDDLATRLSVGSVNSALKIVRVAFNDAVRDSLLTVSEAAKVKTLNKSNDKTRRPFSLDELARLFAAAEGEWRGLILCGLYSGGQRLGDIARLTWQNVNLQQNEISFVTQKTSRPMVLPLASPFREYLLSIPSSDNPKAPLFPVAYESIRRSKDGFTGTLSNQFYQLLVQAGLASPRSRENTGKGHGSRRQTGELSFHSMRHTATSLLKNLGVSNAVVQDMVGHDSVAVSANYTKIDMETKRAAIAKLPDLYALGVIKT